MYEIIHGFKLDLDSIWIIAQTSPEVISETIICQNYLKSRDSVVEVACFGAELPTFEHITKN